jgi:hypothetical protein
MSKAEPMPLKARLEHYTGLSYYAWAQAGRLLSERDLTPAQRRRAWRKAHRCGERGNENEVLYGRKGRPTPRQRKPQVRRQVRARLGLAAGGTPWLAC